MTSPARPRKKSDRTGRFDRFQTIVSLLNSLEFLENRCHFRTVTCTHSNVLPFDRTFLVDNKHGRAGNLFLWVQHIVCADEVAVRIGQDRESQPQLARCLLSRHRRVGTDGDQLGAECPDVIVTFLQLPELRLAKRSVVHPVEYNQDVLFSLVVFQVDRRPLNRHTCDIRRDAFLSNGRPSHQQGEKNDESNSIRFHLLLRLLNIRSHRYKSYRNRVFDVYREPGCFRDQP